MSNLIEATTTIFETLSSLASAERRRVLTAVGALLEEDAAPLPLPLATPPASGFDAVKAAPVARLPKGDGRGRSGRSAKPQKNGNRTLLPQNQQALEKILTVLRRHPEGMTSSELSRETGIPTTSSTWSAAREQIVKKGLASCNSRSRAARWTATSTGER